MKNIFLLISVISIFFLFNTTSFALTIGASPADSIGRAEDNILDKKKADGFDNVKVEKTAVIINKREGNKIFTTAGVYDISGAKIIDLTINKTFPPKQKKSAILTFVNGKLIEVVIQ